MLCSKAARTARGRSPETASSRPRNENVTAPHAICMTTWGQKLSLWCMSIDELARPRCAKKDSGLCRAPRII